ncbi:MAG: putative sensor protein [Frankiales bacterium]|nr:putative sensor protein [Frankiales bacterium]
MTDVVREPRVSLPDNEVNDVFADLARLAQLVVPVADYASITVETNGRRYTAAATADIAVAFDREQQRHDTGPLVDAMAGEDPVVVVDLTDDARWRDLAPAAGGAGVRSVLSVPVPYGQATHASVNLYAVAPDAFGPAETAAIRVVARQAALALDHLHSWHEERIAHGQDYRIAAALQQSLLPRIPEIPGIRIAAKYAPSDIASVGGDWYDVIHLPDGAIGVMIGDVMGHDLAAAAGMGQIRSVLRAYAWELAGPALVLDQVDSLMRGLEMGPLATVVYGRLVIDGDAVMLRYSAAGHPPPLLVYPEGTTQFLDLGRSAVLGAPVSAAEQRGEGTAFLPRGSTLLLYTNGLVQHRGRTLDEGMAMLCEAASGHCPDDSVAGLCDYVLSAMVDGEQADDIALIAIHVDEMR